MQTIDLPIVLEGRPIYPDDSRDVHVLEYPTGVRVRVPKTSVDDLGGLQSDRFKIADLHTQEIVGFLGKVGEFWSTENVDHDLYRTALTQMSAILGLSTKMAQRELNLARVICSTPGALYDMLDAEFGNRMYNDEWLPNDGALVHAQPWGNVVHVMVGNVPVTSILSLVRSLLTKNNTIAKLPKRDPITALYFALSMIEIMPDHPITKSMNIVYWPGGDEAEEHYLRLADVACVWGGGEAVLRAKSLVREGVNVLEFGPKTSFAVIGRESAGSPEVATEVAHDVSIYNQEACFSPQIVFVEDRENVPVFVNQLIGSLTLFNELLPRGDIADDIHAQITRARLEALIGGDELYVAENGTDWTVAVISSPDDINEHPLGRCVYVVPVDDIREVVSYCTPNTQTIALSPWYRNTEIRDKATLYGAAKIVETGMVESHRIGIPHDNIFPLHSLVRWVGVERDKHFWGKYIPEGPVDTTRYLMQDVERPEHAEDVAIRSASTEARKGELWLRR